MRDNHLLTKQLSSVFCLFVFAHLTNAQIKVRGILTDKDKQPLPFVDVFLKSNPSLGTITDETGHFSITIPRKKKKKENSFLVFSYVGFHTKTIKINPRTGYLKIVLKEESDQLDEVVVITKPKKRLKKKENPAYKILKEVWKRKRKNGLDYADAYAYKKHVITQIGLNNVDSTLYQSVDEAKLHDKEFEIPHDDQGRPYLPFYVEEKQYQVYGRNNPSLERLDLTAERVEGLGEKSFLFDRLSNIFEQPIDIYKNNILLLRKSFVSPIASSGFATYDYVLYDTLTKNDRDQYQIFFFPREDGDLVFEGSMLIDAASYAVSRIRMKTHKDINMNFIRGLELDQSFYIKNDSVFYPKTYQYKADFIFISKNEHSSGMVVERLTNFDDYEMGKPQSDEFYANSIKKYRSDQFKKSADYWDKNELSKQYKETYETIDAFKNNKRVNQLSSAVNVLSSGYFNVLPNLQMGPFWLFVGSNQVEGTRINLPFRTFYGLDDRFRLNSFIAYGTKDEAFKYGATAMYLLSYKPRIEASIGYAKDVVNFSEGTGLSDLLPNSFRSQNILNRGENIAFHWEEKVETGLNIRLVKNLRFALTLRRRDLRSALPDKFDVNYQLSGQSIENSFVDTHTDASLIFTPRRFVYGYGVEQRMGRNLYPALIFNYRRGYSGLLGGAFDYHKLQFDYKHPLRLGAMGMLEILLEVGKTYGTVPLSLLSPLPANQRLTIQPATFALMNYYDFITDTYFLAHFDHHFSGLIFNRIPWVKKLNLRSVVSFRTAWGEIGKHNIDINRSERYKYQAPNAPVYYEYGVGIENIGYKNLRIFRVDAIWRNDYHSSHVNMADESSRFGVRLRIKPNF